MIDRSQLVWRERICIGREFAKRNQCGSTLFDRCLGSDAGNDLWWHRSLAHYDHGVYIGCRSDAHHRRWRLAWRHYLGGPSRVSRDACGGWTRRIGQWVVRVLSANAAVHRNPDFDDVPLRSIDLVDTVQEYRLAPLVIHSMGNERTNAIVPGRVFVNARQCSESFKSIVLCNRYRQGTFDFDGRIAGFASSSMEHVMNETKFPILLELRNLTKTFFGVQVLKSIHLKLVPGQVLGLVGQNGAGKSTLMNIVGGNLQPESGEMLLRECPYLPTTPREALRLGVGMVHQDLNLFPNLSITENLFINDLPGLSRILEHRSIFTQVKS